MLIAGSISRLIKIIGVKEPTNDATETANTIPVPTTNPINGSVFKNTSAVRLIIMPQRTPKITPFKAQTSISFLTMCEILSS